jgi:uncharacterized membrane protein YiaA
MVIAGVFFGCAAFSGQSAAGIIISTLLLAVGFVVFLVGRFK